MRVISAKTLKRFWENYPETKHRLFTWYKEVVKAEWNNHNELKRMFGSASILNEKRVIFNILGNKYRLIVDIEYHIKVVFLVWFGTHDQYDKIDAKAIKYDNTDKK